MPEAPKYNQPVEKPNNKPAKSSGAVHASASSNRPYVCPYEGCDKAYIHEYKLNLHLRKEHPGHFPDENAKNAQPAPTETEMDEDVAQDTYPVKRKNTKTPKQIRPKPNLKPPPAKARLQNASASPANLSIVNKPWPVKEEAYEEEEDEDSEETEEEKFNVRDQWRHRENEDDEDEDTELED